MITLNDLNLLFTLLGGLKNLNQRISNSKNTNILNSLIKQRKETIQIFNTEIKRLIQEVEIMKQNYTNNLTTAQLKQVHNYGRRLSELERAMNEDSSLFAYQKQVQQEWNKLYHEYQIYLDTISNQ
ncbi:hypothetical protein [Streptococcus salivarius]|uniref:Uncharacterized protein n=1 Tax=Streptococcus salivarius TaxID=1304 RepID=A0AB37CK44_STRSL|nr:hypothetical protein [Streptococcus salivarius]QEM31619.1 hypothetical protein FHI56_01225 [Streptococcus salivarius]